MSYGGRATQPARALLRSCSGGCVRCTTAWHTISVQHFPACFVLRAPPVVAGLEETTYDQFLAGLESPACFYLLKAEPSNERLMLDIEPALLHSMIDRLLGGNGNEPPPCRPMTEIELCVAARIVRQLLEQCGSAWRGVLDLRPEVVQAESNPRLLRVFPADEAVFVVSMELDLGEVRGIVRLCLPMRVVEPAADKQWRVAAQPAAAADETVEAVVTLARTPITSGEVSGLHMGDIIATETPADSPATVSLTGVEKLPRKAGSLPGPQGRRDPGGNQTITVARARRLTFPDLAPRPPSRYGVPPSYLIVAPGP